MKGMFFINKDAAYKCMSDPLVLNNVVVVAAMKVSLNPWGSVFGSALIYELLSIDEFFDEFSLVEWIYKKD